MILRILTKKYNGFKKCESWSYVLKMPAVLMGETEHRHLEILNKNTRIQDTMLNKERLHFFRRIKREKKYKLG